MEIEYELCKPFTLAFGGLLGYFAQLDWELFIIYLVMMMLDVFIGKHYAKANGEYDSKVNRYGLYHKMGELIVLIALIFAQRSMLKSGIKVPVSPAMTTLFIFMELGSILETAARNNVKLPKKVLAWFKFTVEALNDKGDDGDHRI